MTGAPGRVPSIRIVDSGIEVIDQTRLPDELDVVTITTLDAAVDAIQRLMVRGAPAIGAFGALALAVGVSRQDPQSLAEATAIVQTLGGRLSRARPTAVNLQWAIERVIRAASAATTAADLCRIVMEEATRIVDEDQDVCQRIGQVGRQTLGRKSTILTHCNTGTLATLGIGTALGVVYAKAAAGEPVRVYACETRPLLQGSRLTAWELGHADIDVTVIVDSAAASLLASGRVDAVVVGADRVAANGDTANKIGTLGLAISATRFGVPFYVAAPTSSIDASIEDGQAIEIEERSPNEVWPPCGHDADSAGISVWNPAFDVTPADLITGFITETGLASPPFRFGADVAPVNTGTTTVRTRATGNG